MKKKNSAPNANPTVARSTTRKPPHQKPHHQRPVIRAWQMPGIIRTELLYKTHGEEGVAKLAAGVPLGLGETRDVGLACAYLCGEGGNYLTGICLDVNGGMYMH